MKVRYDEVKEGDRLLVSRDGDKTKREVTVKSVESWTCGDGSKIVKVVHDDGIHYGWVDRFLEKVETGL